jgi:hypothetical protein
MSIRNKCSRRFFVLVLRLHRNQRGVISIVSVFAVLLLTMLLGMVMNAGREVDGKIRLQNAADAAAYSGAVVVARGLNTLAFTNHLLCEVFALTAFMREARDRNSERYAPAILAAWSEVGPVLARSGFPTFDRLGAAIPLKIPLEQELVRSFSEWGAAASEQILPEMEAILGQELIPEFQRAVVRVYPDVAQMAAAEIARHNGDPAHGRGTMAGVLWRSDAMPVGGPSEAAMRTLPVVDPELEDVFEGTYFKLARDQRKALANSYLAEWNRRVLWFFDHRAKMCQFASLWRSFTCGYLKQLLEEEYPRSNLPHVLAREWRKPRFFWLDWPELPEVKEHLDRYFTFLGVVYWRKVPQFAPRLFRNPIESDAVAYAQVRVFIPHPRLVYYQPAVDYPPEMGGMPGDIPTPPGQDPTAPGPETPPPPPSSYDVTREGAYSRWGLGANGWEIRRATWHYAWAQWTLLNENWTTQLVPATMPNLPLILQTAPPVPGFPYAVPNLGGLSAEEIQQISIH